MEKVNNYYYDKGHFDEHERWAWVGVGCLGIYTELRNMIANNYCEKPMERLLLFVTCINIPKLICICNEQQHWYEFMYKYIEYDELMTIQLFAYSI